MPSVQLSDYLQIRADGLAPEQAAPRAGIPLGEAALHERDIEKGELTLPRASARAGAREEHHKGEEHMAREDVRTTVRIGDGPELQIDLDNIDNPANDEAKAEIGKFVGNAINGDADTATARKLKLYVERVERLDSEIKDLNEDKSSVFSEMKGDGFDTKTVKTIIKLRKMDEHARQEAAALLETYARALDLQHVLPL
jgi:uncharacterized protein (UPF0335 family)